MVWTDVNTTFNVNVYDTISNERTEDFTLGIKLSKAGVFALTAPTTTPAIDQGADPPVLSGSVTLTGGADEVAVTLTGSLAALADDTDTANVNESENAREDSIIVTLTATGADPVNLRFTAKVPAVED